MIPPLPIGVWNPPSMDLVTFYYYRNDRPDRPLRRAWGLGARSAHLSAEGARRRQAAYLREARGRLGALLAFVVDWASRPRAAASVQGRRPRPRSGCCALPGAQRRPAAPPRLAEGLQRSGGAAKQAAKLRQGFRTPKAWAERSEEKYIYKKVKLIGGMAA